MSRAYRDALALLALGGWIVWACQMAELIVVRVHG